MLPNIIVIIVSISWLAQVRNNEGVWQKVMCVFYFYLVVYLQKVPFRGSHVKKIFLRVKYFDQIGK